MNFTTREQEWRIEILVVVMVWTCVVSCWIRFKDCVVLDCCIDGIERCDLVKDRI